MLFESLWSSYLEYWQRYWQRCCQDTAEALPKPVTEITQMTPFAPFLAFSDPSSDQTDPAALWQNWATAWQWPRIEAQLQPLETADPTGIGDLMRLSMRIFMPWEPTALQVEALVSRQKTLTLTSHEVDIIPEFAEAQQTPATPKRNKK
jgi:hypothetical protein